MSKLCQNFSNKLHALARVGNYTSTGRLKILGAFVDSQFGYCPIIWMFHNRKLNAKINRLHERVLKIVYKDHSLTYDELLVKDNSFARHEKKIQTCNVPSEYKGTETISFKGPKIWAIVPDEIKNCSSLTDVNQKIIQWKPVGCACRICRICYLQL